MLRILVMYVVKNYVENFWVTHAFNGTPSVLKIKKYNYFGYLKETKLYLVISFNAEYFCFHFQNSLRHTK